MKKIKQRLPQQAVRVGSFERYMQDKDAENGRKFGTLLQEYHDLWVEPRLRALETPWYVRLWRRVRHVADWPVAFSEEMLDVVLRRRKRGAVNEARDDAEYEFRCDRCREVFPLDSAVKLRGEGAYHLCADGEQGYGPAARRVRG